LFLIDGLDVFLAANLLFKDAAAVDGDDEPVLVLQAANIPTACETIDVEFVFAVGGKNVLEKQSATRS
jgi:hypothetical protein